MGGECDIYGKYYSKILNRFAALVFDSMGNIERYLLNGRSFLIRRNSVLSGFSFSELINIHDWTEAKRDCKPFSAAMKSLEAKETYTWLSSAWR